MAYTVAIPQSNDGQLRRGVTIAIPPGATGVTGVVPMGQTDAANAALTLRLQLLFSWDGGITFQDTFPPGDPRRYQNNNDLLKNQQEPWTGGNLGKDGVNYKTPSLGLSIPVDGSGTRANAVTGTIDTQGTAFSGPTGLQIDPNT